MNIIIRSLLLTNFKCFRSKEIRLNDSITTIRGRNGVGKTTIADAILWCLFGKNSQGQSDFDLKTHDENGKPIPNIDHSVELQLMVTDGTSFEGPGSANLKIIPITLKRTLKETWVKKRGSDEQVFKNNTTEYLVNGDNYTAADYKKYIAQLIDEDVFRAITNPSYFPSLKWQRQREFLASMAGEISNDDIVGNSEDLKNLSSEEAKDIVAYRKHLSYQIKQIKDKLEKIPVRLEEQNKALPERLDWPAIEQMRADVLRQQEKVNQQYIAIKSGNGGDVLREQIRKEIKDVQNEIDNMESQERKSYVALMVEHDRKVAEYTRQFNQLVTTQRDLEQQIHSHTVLAERCKTTAEDTFKKEQAYVRTQWPNTQICFDINGDDAHCSYCGQLLPPDLIEVAREKFNKRKAELKLELTERAQKAKKLLAEAEEESKTFLQKKEEAEQALADTKQKINDVFSEKAKLEKEKFLSVEEVLYSSPKYNDLLNQKKELTDKLESVDIDDYSASKLTELEALNGRLKAEASNYQFQLSTRQQYEHIQSLIAGIIEEQKSLITQLSELEYKEDIARQYQERQNTILESRINQLFSIVQWRLFRTVNNGGDPFDEPYCECYVNGVAYHDGLNQAGRLNAGLDIINTLCRHYNISAPIVLDNSESTINIIETIGQQIRLQVADTDFQIV